MRGNHMTDTPRLCVCGHTEDCHGALSKQCYGGEPGTPDDVRDDCEGPKFRLCLPWPDAEGWWWMSSLLDSERRIYANQISWCDDSARVFLIRAPLPLVRDGSYGVDKLLFPRCE